MITLVAGARPNFVKLAPIIRELQRRSVPFRWIHTGQHTGAMSDPFLNELELPHPDLQLRCTGSHAETTAAVMVGVEKDLHENRPDWLVVLGDVNSTLGAAIAAVKLGVKIAHVEAGYRSDDWDMPEEVNRVLVDRMSDLLLCADHRSAGILNCYELEAINLGARVHVVGNVMMDSLRWALDRTPSRPNWSRREPYAVLTVHRPALADNPDEWARLPWRLRHVNMPILWPSHPRTGLRDLPGVERIKPLSYLDMVALLRDCAHVITDSGGVLEEALYLGKPVTSLRDPMKNERQHLLDRGVPEIWKTDAAPRIVDALTGHA